MLDVMAGLFAVALSGADDGTAATGADVDAWAPTSSKAPPSRIVIPEPPEAEPSPVAAATPTPSLPTVAAPEAVRSTTAGAPSVAARTQGSTPRKIEHRGFLIEPRLGAIGCTGAVCAGNGGHDASPGVYVGGMLGGNLGGWLDLGLRGGWGQLQPNVTPGTNALALYGLDAGALQDELMARMGGAALGVDLSQLTVQSAKSQAAQAGLSLRIHLVPRGRFAAWVGTGALWSMVRTRYATDLGPTRLDLHGVSVPLEGGIGVYVTRHLALTFAFDYAWTRYAVGVLDHPLQRAAAPLGVLERAAEAFGGGDLRQKLPNLWTASLGLRTTF